MAQDLLTTNNPHSSEADYLKNATAKALSELIDKVEAAILKVDMTGNIIFINEYALKLFEHSSSELIGQSLIGPIIPKNEKTWSIIKNIFEHNIFKLSAAKLPPVIIESTLRTGKTIFVEWHINPITGESPAENSIIISGNDISSRVELETSLKEAKTQAEEANKAKSDFLANMSHEIRTPLNGIIGLSDILFNKEKDEHKRNMMELVLNSGKNLLYLINGILDLSRIESGRTTMEKKEFFLLDAVQSVFKIFKPQAEEKNVDFQFEYEKSIPQIVFGDEGKLKQILINLLGNALKFTKSRGKVSLKVNRIITTDSEVRVVFVISDSGIGIPKDKIPLIFDRFYQVDASKTRKFGGTGLGLSIVKALVEMMNAAISVQSEEEMGTSFEVEIPFGRVIKVTSTDFLDGMVQILPSKSLDILVAEDIFLNQSILQMALEEAGHLVDIADNGLIAYEKASKKDFDLIIMDIQMPVMDGYEATKKLRAEGYKNKILAFTAFAMEGDKEKCISAGMDDYLTKPVVLKDLHKKIAELFR